MTVTIDFFTVLAFFIPGIFVAKGLSYFVVELNSLFMSIDSNIEKGSFFSSIVMILCLSIVFGMGISTIRAVTIDKTFSWDLRFLPIVKNLPHYGSAQRQEPDYEKLAANGRLAAFQEAKQDEKRPYQFYGNIMLALWIFIFGRFLGRHKGPNMQAKERVLKLLIGITLAFLIFYPACRLSHYNYMLAVEALSH